MSDDIIIVERQPDVRKIVSVPGRFSFADVRDVRGERRVFGCHAVNPSIREIVIASPVTAKMNARVIAFIDHLGKLDGLVTCVLQRGFVINAKQQERRKLAAKIEWLRQHGKSEVREQRADSRFVPKNPYSRMILADGHVETCLILDVSVSGAAISADTVPAIGTVLAVGTITSRVVRHFDEGFAVRFIERQSRDTVEISLADADA
jgi:hypothetical protein